MTTIALHKPYGVLSQYTPDGSPNRTLAELGLRQFKSQLANEVRARAGDMLLLKRKG